MKTVEDFISRITPDVTGCDSETVINAVTDTIISFCKDVCVFQYKFASTVLDSSIITTGGIHYLDFSVSSLTDKIPYKVNYIKLGGTTYEDKQDTINKLCYNDLLTDSAYYDLDQNSLYFCFAPNNKVRIYPVSWEGSTTLEIEVVYVPTRDFTQIDDWFYEHYVDTIAHGTKALLFISGDTPTVSVSRYQLERVEYHRGIAEAKRRLLHGCQNKSGHVRYRAFGGY